MIYLRIAFFVVGGVLLLAAGAFYWLYRFFENEKGSKNIKYVGIKLDDCFMQIGFNPEYSEQQIEEQLLHVAQYRHIGQNGFVVICNSEGKIVSDSLGNVGKNISIFGQDDSIKVVPNEIFRAPVNNIPCYCMYSKVNDFAILVAMTEEEVYFTKKASVYMLAFMETIVFAIFFATIFVLVKLLVALDQPHLKLQVAYLSLELTYSNLTKNPA